MEKCSLSAGKWQLRKTVNSDIQRGETGGNGGMRSR